VLANSGIPLEEWSGSGATKELHKSIREFNEVASKQTQTLTRLTWAIFILTAIMVIEVAVQIYLSIKTGP
jgi:hypothetical protein